MRLFSKLPRRALILGCGPAGIFAAHALYRAGWDFTIYSRKREESPMYGAQYLHAPVPGTAGDDNPVKVNVLLEGSWEESTRKVYGPAARPQVSFEEYLKTRGYAWDIRAAYYSLFQRHSSAIVEREVTPELLKGVIESSTFSLHYGLVINSIWRNGICLQPGAHTFNSQEFWASGDAPALGLMCPISCPPDTVILNGTADRAWYRVSNVFGHTTAEWPIDRKPPIPNVARVIRPLGTNCDCWPGMLHVGRYGSWAPGVLSHTAFTDTLEAVVKLG